MTKTVTTVEGTVSGKRGKGIPIETFKMRTVVDLPIDSIIASPDNPRKIKPGDKMIIELAESIKATGGVLVPVIVRHHPTEAGMYDLRAGACRLMASVLAGFSTIKAEVMELDDRQAKEVTAIENLKRRDLTPLEEAEGIKRIMAVAADPNDIEHVAATLGWSLTKVYKRMALVNLTPKWRKALAVMPPEGRGERRGAFGLWGVGHMELIARHEPEMQELLLAELSRDWHAGEMSVGDLNEYLGKKFLLVKKAPWKSDDETLLPEAGACNNCPKRSSRVPHLFDDMDDAKAGSGDRCLDPACWEKKSHHFVDRRAAELQKDHENLVFVTGEYVHEGSEKNKLLKRFPKMEWSGEFFESKKGERGAIPALVVNGDEAGKVRWVRSDRSNWRGSKAKAKGADGKTSMADRRKRLQGRRNAHAITALKEALLQYDPVAGLGCRDGLEKFAVNVGLRLLVILTVFGTGERHDNRDKTTWDDAERWPLLVGEEFIRSEKWRDDFIRRAWAQLGPVFRQRLLFYDTAMATEAIPEARKIAGLTGIDFDALLKAAEETIREPKSWATEKAAPAGKAEKGKKQKAKRGACRVCGCTDNKPCTDEGGNQCAWTDKTETLCTACKDKAAAKAAKQKKGVTPVKTRKRKGGGKGC